MILISATLPSNASLLEFYNEVMTFNDSVMELVCCKLDGTPVTISCGRGFSCAAACYSKEAVLCPSHNCDECDNVDEDKEEGSENVEKTGRRLSWSTQFSGAMNHCTRRGCQVGRRSKYCCFHPVCRRQKKRQCSWLQYFLGRLSISKSFQTFQAPPVRDLVRLLTAIGPVRSRRSLYWTHTTLMVRKRPIQVMFKTA